MKRINVLELIDRGFLGGGQVVLLTLARHLDRERFCVAVSAEEQGPLAGEVRRSGIPFFPISFRRRLRLEVVRQITAILRDEKIDLLHTHGGIAGFFGRLAARRAGTAVIVHTLHGIHYLHYRDPLRKRLYMALERRFSRWTDAVVCVSESDREKAVSLRLVPHDRVHVIRNGVHLDRAPDPEGRESMRSGLGLDPVQPVVGTVARLHRQKGLVYLVRAAAHIRRRFPQARVVIVGGGPLAHDLRREAVRAGVSEVCLFLGERLDAHEILSLFDVFVLPSLWEGLPLALVEAACIGMPIVATDIDGVREVVRPGDTGILVPPADPEKLAGAIIGLLEDPERAARLGRNAKAAIPPDFSLPRMIEATEKLYLDLFRDQG